MDKVTAQAQARRMRAHGFPCRVVPVVCRITGATFYRIDPK